ncbi:dld [Symbiodinium sp. CCMP2592]|nr:dld [Symbiodinium sp. CCMP2592]
MDAFVGYSFQAIPERPQRIAGSGLRAGPGQQAPKPRSSELSWGFAALASTASAITGAAIQRRRKARTSMRQSNVAKESQQPYSQLVAEDRMITIQESQIRYAGAAIIALVGVYKYVGMVAAGSFDYAAIAANAAGAWGVFESGRQSI